METKLYIFSAKDGMQWLSGPKSEASRLTFIRQKIGRLVDFNAGERSYRGILIYEKMAYIYACFLAPRFDFRGRDATYFIFTEIETSFLANLNVKALLRSKIFTQPLTAFQEDLSLSLSTYIIEEDTILDSEDAFSNIAKWIAQVTPLTGIRLHQEEGKSVTINNEATFDFQNTVTTQNIASWNSSASSLQANLHAIEQTQYLSSQQTIPFATWNSPKHSTTSPSIKKINRNKNILWRYVKYALVLLLLLVAFYIIYHTTTSSDSTLPEVRANEISVNESAIEDNIHSSNDKEESVTHE